MISICDIAGMLYPEFGHRRPPPTYAASMQEYQQQLVLAQQQYMDSVNTDNYSLPSSPPPTYRSHVSVRPGIPITFPPSQTGQYPSSRPPTYRSHSSTLGQQQPHARPALPLEQSASTGGAETPGVHQGEQGAVNGADMGVTDIVQSSRREDCVSNVSNSNGAQERTCSVTSPFPTRDSVTHPPPPNGSSISPGIHSNSSNSGHSSVQQSPSKSQAVEESVENLLETTLRTFDEITNSVVNSESDATNSSCGPVGGNYSSGGPLPMEPHTNTITSQTPL